MHAYSVPERLTPRRITVRPFASTRWEPTTWRPRAGAAAADAASTAAATSARRAVSRITRMTVAMNRSVRVRLSGMSSEIHVHEFTTVDGVVDAPTWTMDFGFDPRMGEAIGALTGRCRAILLGRKTYEMFEPA